MTKRKDTYAGIRIADPAVKLPKGLTKARLRRAVADTLAERRLKKRAKSK